ncbi:hypothetical protein [Suttonella ornithocola]|uniref:Uncharacterized protein n=1 Tax=Suttonella ornithocola TaxID=279832 RepID=A0A380MYP3_9GAMM|nr:hypothetical protein [Suttonella ornithocola]SUO96801.1 Uncharacterised protein [Suttonella ornithocola]
MATKNKLYLTAEIPSIGEQDSEILYLKLEKEDGEIVFESHFKPCVYLT